MTNEEAIKIILNYSVYGCGYCHQGSDEIPEAFTIATKALEKQIPKKPIIKPYFDAVCCPICIETIDSISIGNHRDKYCHNCGQKISWEGENNVQDLK